MKLLDDDHQLVVVVVQTMTTTMLESVTQRVLAMENGEWILSQMNDDLKTMSLDCFVTDLLNKNLIAWNHPSFTKYRNREKEQDDFVLNPFEVEEGVVTCYKCGSRRVFSTTIQTRAADEPMTTVAHCMQCKTKWSQNG